MRDQRAYRIFLAIAVAIGLFLMVRYFPDAARADDSSAAAYLGGIILTVFGCLAFLVSVASGRQAASLIAGKDQIAQWRVSLADWKKFLDFNVRRTQSDAKLRNDFIPRPDTAAEGVEIYVGKQGMLIDGTYHVLLPLAQKSVTGISWLDLDASVKCLEISMVRKHARGFGSTKSVLRFPVPREAIPGGERVHTHFAVVTGPEIRAGKKRLSWMTIGSGLMIAAGLIIPQGEVDPLLRLAILAAGLLLMIVSLIVGVRLARKANRLP